MAKNEKVKKGLDTAGNVATVATVLADTGATGGLIATGKLMWEAITAGHNRRRRMQAEDYVNRLAKALGEEGSAALAAELDPDGNHQSWDIVEEGFRVMMAAIHEDAKLAISALVADYVVRQERPDREYQLAGGLLASCDRVLLDAVRDLTAEFRQLEGDTFPDGPPVVDGYTVVKGTGARFLEEVWVLRVALTSERNNRKHSRGIEPPLGLGSALRLLDRYEFGVLPGGASASHPSTYSDNDHHSGGEAQLYVAAEALPRLLRIHKYVDAAIASTGR